MRICTATALLIPAMLAGAPAAHAQPGVLTSARLIEYSPDWTGERFPDGRPKVPMPCSTGYPGRRSRKPGRS